ncbi:MFS-type transporter, putative [Plasmodium ovale wallikeri]|uniref:MFS-type transporter, putative n=1 Tax=Plasmodium ovale wallikeri TaxID=864142 RepID=A0A1A8ZH74_PLAOA|nr:MFS-type transporter, putative [Plasmodium ovale wallikeri]
MLGQFFSSIGQIIFVNAPPEVSLVWFPYEERIISTSVSIISNILGTAIIYLYAPFIVTNEDDIELLLGHICFVSFIGFILVFSFFESGPSYPSNISNSSSSIVEDSINIKLKNKLYKEREDHFNYDDHIMRENHLIMCRDITHFLKQLKKFLQELKIEIKNILSKLELIKILIIFCYSECLISSFSTDISIILKEKLINKNYFSISGSLFIFNTILGSIILCFNTNNKQFKNLIVLCIFMIMLICLLLNFIYNEIVIILTLSLIGFWCGPLQPLSIEMASIRVYPISSNLCTSILQVISFSISAIFISFFSYISNYMNTSYFIFFLSFIVLLISLHIKPIKKQKKKLKNLTFSVRSGLINRNTLQTHKFVDFLNTGGKTKPLLRNCSQGNQYLERDDCLAEGEFHEEEDDCLAAGEFHEEEDDCLAEGEFHEEEDDYLAAGEFHEEEDDCLAAGEFHEEEDDCLFVDEFDRDECIAVEGFNESNYYHRTGSSLLKTPSSVLSSTHPCSSKGSKDPLKGPSKGPLKGPLKGPSKGPSKGRHRKESNTFKIEEMGNYTISDFYTIHLSKKLNMDSLKKEIFYYNQKMKIPNQGPRSFSRLYCDDYSDVFHLTGEKRRTSRYNTY